MTKVQSVILAMYAEIQQRKCPSRTACLSWSMCGLLLVWMLAVGCVCSAVPTSQRCLFVRHCSSRWRRVRALLIPPHQPDLCFLKLSLYNSVALVHTSLLSLS